MDNLDFTKLNRKQLIQHFEHERQIMLKAGMSEADIFRIHFGQEHESGRGGDYRMWLNERKHIRPDHKYAPGSPVSFETADSFGSLIGSDCAGLSEVEINYDLNAALAKLTPLQRSCFIESKLNGMTQQEIADKLGVSQQCVLKHINAAKKKLQKVFSR